MWGVGRCAWMCEGVPRSAQACVGVLRMNFQNTFWKLQCHPNQTVIFQVGRKCKKNHLCEIPFTMLKIYAVNISYMDLDLVF